MFDINILNPCITFTQAFERASKLKLSSTETQIMISLYALTNTSYDEIAKVTGLSSATLRATATSPLRNLVKKELAKFSTLLSDKGKSLKVFQLTDQGEIVLHFLITGKNREVANNE